MSLYVYLMCVHINCRVRENALIYGGFVLMGYIVVLRISYSMDFKLYGYNGARGGSR